MSTTFPTSFDPLRYGTSPVVHRALIGQDPPLPTYPQQPTSIIWPVITSASVAISAYHGYKRNDSIGWAIVWGLLGGMFPIITPAIAFAQGIDKRGPR